MNTANNRVIVFLVFMSVGVSARALGQRLLPSPKPYEGIQKLVAQQSRSLRPLIPADAGRFEDITQVILSPDSQWLAYSITRSYDSGVSPERDALRPNQLKEAWIAPVAGGPAKRIFGGEGKGVGAYNFMWSPDSQRLAIISTTPAGYAGLWIWEARTGRLQKLLESEVAIASEVGAWRDTPRWISDHQLIVGVAPEGERSDRVAGVHIATDAAEAAWAKGFGGRGT